MALDRTFPKAKIVLPEHNYMETEDGTDFEPIFPHSVEYYEAKRDKLLKFIELLDEHPDQQAELGVTSEEVELYHRWIMGLNGPSCLPIESIELLSVEPDSDGKWRLNDPEHHIGDGIKIAAPLERMNVISEQQEASLSS